MGQLFEELKRRNVVRVGIAYLVMSWLVLQIGDVAADNLGFPGWFMPMVFVVLGLGFPVALFLSWAFEMTPEGVKRTEEVDADASITPATGKKLEYVIIAGLIAAVGFLFLERGGEPATPAAPADKVAAKAAPIIAVLPFVNMSSDPEQEYFSDGISEEILNVLARTDGLQVVSRTSSFAFKGADRDITEIAASLNANIILEGSVRKGGNRVRITAQLIDAKTGLHLWSDTYDRELTDIFAVQDEISKAIATALLGAVGIEALPEKRFGGTEDMIAYNTYLQANALLTSRGTESIAEAARLYELATASDPGFANAWGGLAKARMLVINSDAPLDDDAINEAANRALAIDPDNGPALSAQGLLRFNRLAFDEGRALMERAVVATPNDADAHFWLGLIAKAYLDYQTAVRELEIGRRLNPSNPNLLTNLLGAYLEAGMKGKSQALLERLEKGEEPVDPRMAQDLRPLE
ncbi:MAG: hypothetical protein V3R73_08080, partial [Sphingomonadales bacterium]